MLTHRVPPGSPEGAHRLITWSEAAPLAPGESAISGTFESAGRTAEDEDRSQGRRNTLTFTTMAKILVVGGFGPPNEDPKLSEPRAQFAEFVGCEIVSRSHILIGGCRTRLDATVAKGNEAALVKGGLPAARGRAF
jgi:hypothetical protein